MVVSKSLNIYYYTYQQRPQSGLKARIVQTHLA
jgi:hypothetical protein